MTHTKEQLEALVERYSKETGTMVNEVSLSHGLLPRFAEWLLSQNLQQNTDLKWRDFVEPLPKVGDTVGFIIFDGSGVGAKIIERDKDIQWLRSVAMAWHPLPPMYEESPKTTE